MFLWARSMQLIPSLHKVTLSPWIRHSFAHPITVAFGRLDPCLRIVPFSPLWSESESIRHLARKQPNWSLMVFACSLQTSQLIEFRGMSWTVSSGSFPFLVVSGFPYSSLGLHTRATPKTPAAPVARNTSPTYSPEIQGWDFRWDFSSSHLKSHPCISGECIGLVFLARPSGVALVSAQTYVPKAFRETECNSTSQGSQKVVVNESRGNITPFLVYYSWIDKVLPRLTFNWWIGLLGSNFCWVDLEVVGILETFFTKNVIYMENGKVRDIKKKNPFSRQAP